MATFADAKNCVVSGAIIYEIKPYSQLKTLAGEIQLNRYQTAARNQGITIHIAKHDPGVGTVLAPDGTVLYTQFLNGVIYYDDEPIPEDALQRAQQKQSQTSVDVTKVLYFLGGVILGAIGIAGLATGNPSGLQQAGEMFSYAFG